MRSKTAFSGPGSSSRERVVRSAHDASHGARDDHRRQERRHERPDVHRPRGPRARTFPTSSLAAVAPHVVRDLVHVAPEPAGAAARAGARRRPAAARARARERLPRRRRCARARRRRRRRRTPRRTAARPRSSSHELDVVGQPRAARARAPPRRARAPTSRSSGKRLAQRREHDPVPQPTSSRSRASGKCRRSVETISRLRARNQKLRGSTSASALEERVGRSPPVTGETRASRRSPRPAPLPSAR